MSNIGNFFSASLSVSNLPATVARLGDPDAGNVYIRVSNIVYDCLIYTQQRQTDETVKWIETPTNDILSETQADAYLERQIKYDKDIWIKSK